MSDLHGALKDIALIRAQVAKGSQFRGFGPFTLSATGVIALLLAAVQRVWLKQPGAHADKFVAAWCVLAAFSVIVIGIEAAIRSHRVHGNLALPLMQQAATHLCPSLVASGLLTMALLRAAPSTAWMLPGLWEVIFSLGAFAMAPILPRPMFLVGVWYLLCGLVCIQRGPEDALSGWAIGIPFGIGQLMVAAILNWKHGHSAC